MKFPYLVSRRLPNFQIFTFHRVTVGRDPFFPGTQLEVFKRQVDFLSRNYCIVDLARLISMLENHEPIPTNAVALTFDDGYRDNYELGFPVLQRYGAPATIFLTTGFVNREDVLWNDKISFALKQTRCPRLEIECEGYRRFSLDSVEQRLAAIREILWLLFHVAHEKKLALVDEILTQLEVHEFGQLWDGMLKWSQIREMRQQGISFGAHTVTHPVLSRQPLQQARQEICLSKQTIEMEINTPVTLFAYPVGRPVDISEELKSSVREMGFKAAVTTIFGTNTCETDRFALRRGGPTDSDIAAFAAKQCWYKLAL